MRIAIVLTVFAAACGRAGPGATLTTRKDPDIEAREIRHQECVKLRSHSGGHRRGGRHNGRASVGSFQCEAWKNNGVEQVAAVRPDEVPPHTGPAPLLAAVPVLSVGRGVAGSGASESAAFWVDAGIQLQLVPRWDRIALYGAATYFGVGDQSDLSGVSFTAGAMVALTAGWTIEAHGGVVTAEHTPWRKGVSLRYRPMHLTTFDWTVHLGVEYVQGDDVMRRTPPFVLEPNHSTGVLLGFTGGLLP